MSNILISKTAELNWSNRIKTYYISRGYTYTKDNDKFTVKVEDLTDGSHALVEVKCDCDLCDNPTIKTISWRNYVRCVKDDGLYYCRLCAIKLYGGENSRKTKLNSSISFAQWGIDNIGNDFLDKYWDYEKNKINPFEVAYGYTRSKVWIKCQETNYHGSYAVDCSHFTEGKRCSYCAGKKVHLLDSLGYIYPQSVDLWSCKNKKSPFKYTCGSGHKVWWKCHKGEHKDYKRTVNDATKLEFRCPECSFSKGEEGISNVLVNYGYCKIEQAEYESLIGLNVANSNYYVPQKSYNNLVGVKNGLLSYDFWIPKLNLLIEYQGEFHDNDNGSGTKYMKSKFPIQQEHDRRKREYAQNNNINLLEIWYWDFDNIEEILSEYLAIECKEGSTY